MTSPDCPTLDILLPFYGDVELMREAVRSVLAQRDGDWTLRVLDDCNPDKSVEEWLGHLGDPRVYFERSPTNLGINSAFQRVLESAQSDYIVFMGCDDLMLPNFVGLVRDLARDHPNASMIQPGVRVIDERGHASDGLVEKVKRSLNPCSSGTMTLAGERLAISLLRGNWAYFPAMCWRRESVQEVGFRPGLETVQDLALMLDLVFRGSEMVVRAEPAFQYRRHSASLSSVNAMNGQRFQEEATFFKAIQREASLHGWQKAARAARFHATSRLHAVAKLPHAIASRRFSQATQLVQHAGGW